MKTCKLKYQGFRDPKIGTNNETIKNETVRLDTPIELVDVHERSTKNINICILFYCTYKGTLIQLLSYKCWTSWYALYAQQRIETFAHYFIGNPKPFWFNCWIIYKFGTNIKNDDMLQFNKLPLIKLTSKKPHTFAQISFEAFYWKSPLKSIILM